MGTGNGQLLFSLSLAGFTSLHGIDYSPSSISLARSIASTRAESHPPIAEIQFSVGDILGDEAIAGVSGKGWPCVMDKGTYDAVCLSDEEREGRRIGQLYPMAVSRLLGKGGVFLITSCEFSRCSAGASSFALEGAR